MAKLTNTDRFIIAGTAVVFLYSWLAGRKPPDDPGNNTPAPENTPDSGAGQPIPGDQKEPVEIWTKPEPADNGTKRPIERKFDELVMN